MRNILSAIVMIGCACFLLALLPLWWIVEWCASLYARAYEQKFR